VYLEIELTYPKRENVRIGLKGKKIFLPHFRHKIK